ncbi:MAG: ACP S-malonyltransferase, partial [Ardenticatenia bacterium]
AQPTTDVDAIRHELIEQLTGSVRWTESVQAMRAAGVQTFIEFGPGGVLSGLIKRIDRKAGRLAFASVEDLQQVQA